MISRCHFAVTLLSPSDAANVDWQDVNSLVRPGVVRLFTYQLISRGAGGVLYFLWRQPRIGAHSSRDLPRMDSFARAVLSDYLCPIEINFAGNAVH